MLHKAIFWTSWFVHRSSAFAPSSAQRLLRSEAFGAHGEFAALIDRSGQVGFAASGAIERAPSEDGPDGSNIVEFCPHHVSLVGGNASKVIPDNDISASSTNDSASGQRRSALWQSRLDNDKEASWTAGASDLDQWLEWNLESPQLVTGFRTRGNAMSDEWVTHYNVSYSPDGISWHWLMDNPRTGNQDRQSIVQQEIWPPVRALLVRVAPVAWRGRPSMRAELLGCGHGHGVCALPLGLVGEEIQRIIPDTSITASSYFANDTSHGFRQMWRARLGCNSSSWTADAQDTQPFIQWDLGVMAHVVGVRIRGRPDEDCWVTQFTLSHSKDGVTWSTLTKNITANSDRNSIVERGLKKPMEARFVRLHPI